MGIDDVRAGRALYHDLTCASLARAGLDVPEFAPAEAGQIAARQAAAFDLTVFEHFVTDFYGHAGDMAACVAAVETLDAFLGGVVAGVGARAGAGDTDDASSGVTVLLTSDHGNIEDNRTAMHTDNPVPVLAFGPRSGPFAGVREITDIAPAVAAAIGVPFFAPPGATGGG
jgi:bisphosphoglycerate-independent phosphoglycerate mutase (AlkP superfamily)